MIQTLGGERVEQDQIHTKAPVRRKGRLDAIM